MSDGFTPDEAIRVTFVCVQNAGRSQVATAFAKRECDQRSLEIEVLSGGIHPADDVHHVVLDVMDQAGFDLSGHTLREITTDELETCEYVATMAVRRTQRAAKRPITDRRPVANDVRDAMWPRRGRAIAHRPLESVLLATGLWRRRALFLARRERKDCRSAGRPSAGIRRTPRRRGPPRSGARGRLVVARTKPRRGGRYRRDPSGSGPHRRGSPAATFDRVDARRARFDGADLEGATFVDADLRDASLDRAKLYRTGFTDVCLNRGSDFGDGVVYEDLASGANDRAERIAGFEAASWTYRELRRLFERDALPRQARACYLGEKSARRRAAWARGEYLRALKLEGSRWVMRYGTSPTRVVVSSIALIVICAALYPMVGGLRESVEGTYGLENPPSNCLRRHPTNWRCSFSRGCISAPSRSPRSATAICSPLGRWHAVSRESSRCWALC